MGSPGTCLPQRGADAQPVCPGHHNVQHHQVGQGILTGGEQSVPAGEGPDLKALLGEKGGDQLPNILFIIGHIDDLRHRTTSSIIYLYHTI